MKYIETVVLSPSEAAERLVFKRFDGVTGEGYQRNVCKNNVQMLSDVASRSKSWVFPVINGVRHGDKIEIVDGQNRSLAAQLSQIETVVAVWEIPEKDRPKVFVDWNKSQPVQPNHVIKVSGTYDKLKDAFSKTDVRCTEHLHKNTTSVAAVHPGGVTIPISPIKALLWVSYVSGNFGNFNSRLTWFNTLSHSDCAKYATTVAKVLSAYENERECVKFEPSLITVICKLIGKGELWLGEDDSLDYCEKLINVMANSLYPFTATTKSSEDSIRKLITI